MKKRDRVFIIPTRYGVMYGAGVLVCVLYGMVYANNLAYLLGFFLLAIFVIGMHQSNSNLKKINIEKVIFQPVASSSVSAAQVYLKSKSSEGHIKIFIESKNSEDKFSSQIEQVQENSLHVSHINISTTGRGKKQTPKLRLHSRYPFGLFYVWRHYTLDSHYYVYPKPNGSRPLQVQGEHSLSLGEDRMHNGDEFEQHKKYQVGESQKRIDWKAYARGRSLLTKEFKQNGSSEVKLSIKDLNLPLEQSLQQLSKWILQCEQLNLNYSLELNNVMIKKGRGVAHKNKCLKALAEV